MLLSAIILAYHTRTEYFEKAVESVFSQDYSQEPFEMILVKDFKSQCDLDLEKSGVRIIYSDPRDSIGKQMVLGVKESRGEIVCFLEDDDLWKQEKLKSVHERFVKNSELDYYHNSFTVIDKDGGTTKTNYRHNEIRRLKRRRSVYCSSLNQFEYSRLLSLGAYFNPSCISVRKGLLLSFFNQLAEINGAQDFFLFVLAVIGDRGILVDDQILTSYRVHSNNSSVGGDPNDRALKLVQRWIGERRNILHLIEGKAQQFVLKAVNFDIFSLGLWKGILLQNSRADIYNESLYSFKNWFRIGLLGYATFWQEVGVLVASVLSPQTGRLALKKLTMKTMFP